MKIRISTFDLLMFVRVFETTEFYLSSDFVSFNIDFRGLAVLTISNKSNPKLEHNGHAYFKAKKLLNGDQKWRCAKNRWEGCHGRACTKKFGQVEMVQVTGQYNRPSKHLKEENDEIEE